MATLPTILLIAAATTTALAAGLLYGYFCSVNPGLHKLSDTEYLTAMQSINRAIQNPVFFSSFLGAPVLLSLSTWMHYSQPIPGRFWLLLAATVVYIFGVIGVTALGNIPLNEALNSFSIHTASTNEIATQRTHFEAPWNTWHGVRTIAAIGALILVILACLNPKVNS